MRLANIEAEIAYQLSWIECETSVSGSFGPAGWYIPGGRRGGYDMI